jgi:hypothetical protein
MRCRACRTVGLTPMWASGPAAPKKPSTAPAASTSNTDPRRTYGRDHLRRSARGAPGPRPSARRIPVAGLLHRIRPHPAARTDHAPARPHRPTVLGRSQHLAPILHRDRPDRPGTQGACFTPVPQHLRPRWERWFTGPPDTPNTWADLDTRHRKACARSLSTSTAVSLPRAGDQESWSRASLPVLPSPNPQTRP